MNDDELVALVSKSFDDLPPVPSAHLELACAAIDLRLLDSELADLLFDSWIDDQEVAMRLVSTGDRLLTFARADVTVDVEIRSDGMIVGQVTLADPEIVGRRWNDVHIEVESATGAVVVIDVDEYGRFRHASTPGPLRLHVREWLVTPWINC